MVGNLQLLAELEVLLRRACASARPLPSLVPVNVAQERRRLVQELKAGQCPSPRFEDVHQRVPSDALAGLDQARRIAQRLQVGDLYLEKLEELELDLAILAAWGDPRRVRPLSARRYGRGDELVSTAQGRCRLSDVARAILSNVPWPEDDPPMVPPVAEPGVPSVGAMVEQAALAMGLDVEVRVEPRLASLAATGEHTVFLADRHFGQREARRLVAHEVFGHLVVAANARAQPLRLLEYGLAGAFADQEGVALFIEECLGLLCGRRIRTLAARVEATRRMHDGAAFGECARALVDDHGFDAEGAIAVTERAYRGGGVARDAGYLAGWLRVRNAVHSGAATLDELRMGRVSVAQVARLRSLCDLGLLRPAAYCPSLALSRRLTDSGTSAATFPPRVAASLTMLELT